MVLTPPLQAREDDWLQKLNPESLIVHTNSLVEPALADFTNKPGTSFQFQRCGYFAVDPESTAAKPVFNRAVTLKVSNATKGIRG